MDLTSASGLSKDSEIRKVFKASANADCGLANKYSCISIFKSFRLGTILKVAILNNASICSGFRTPGLSISSTKTRKTPKNRPPITLTVSIKLFLGKEAPCGVSAKEITRASACSMPCVEAVSLKRPKKVSNNTLLAVASRSKAWSSTSAWLLPLVLDSICLKLPESEPSRAMATSKLWRKPEAIFLTSRLILFLMSSSSACI